jgi:hypothetical protein
MAQTGCQATVLNSQPISVESLQVDDPQVVFIATRGAFGHFYRDFISMSN